jgi:hypothetical protein
MATVGGDGTPLAVPARDARLLHQPPRFVPSDRKAISLELLGHAPTPITLPRLCVNRSHTGQQGRRSMIPVSGRLSVGRGVNAAATDVQHLTQHGNRPCLLVLPDEGISHFDSLAKKPRAFFKISRSIRKRLFSSRNR